MNKGLIREVLLIIMIPALVGILYHATIRDPEKRLAWLREKPIIDTVSNTAVFGEDSTQTNPTGNSGKGNDTTINTPLPKPPVEMSDSVPNAPVKTPPVENPIIPTKPEEVKKKALAVTYQQVVRLNADESVLFFDARNEHEFTEGTIPRAKNIFAMDFEKHIPYILGLEDKNVRIVVFCGGGDCDLSHELSDKLIQFGFTKVFIYLGGYTEWKSKQGK